MLASNETPCFHTDLSPAIQRCCDARNRILLDNMFSESSGPKPDDFRFNLKMLPELIYVAKVGYHARQAANLAYRNAMPDPSTRLGARDFIACVLHGMAVEAIRDDEGARLLAGAKVALASQRYTHETGKQRANANFNRKNDPQTEAA